MRALLLLVLLLGACGGDDDCGPGDAAGDLEVGDLAFGGLTSSPNNDCTPQQGDPTSLTIEADQTAPDGNGFLVLCLPRPHEIGADPIPLDDEDHVQVIDLRGQDADGCEVDVADVAEGTATFTGYCDDGGHEAGYALTLAGSVSVTRTCGDQDPTTEDLALSGTAPVTAEQF